MLIFGGAENLSQSLLLAAHILSHCPSLGCTFLKSTKEPLKLTRVFETGATNWHLKHYPREPPNSSLRLHENEIQTTIGKASLGFWAD